MVIFAVLVVAFIVDELWMGDKATPLTHTHPGLASKRNIAALSLLAFFNYARFSVLVYLIPVSFQDIKRTSAEHSGIDTIPLVVANTVASLSSGFLKTRFGTYVQYLWLLRADIHRRRTYLNMGSRHFNRAMGLVSNNLRRRHWPRSRFPPSLIVSGQAGAAQPKSHDGHHKTLSHL